MGRNYYDILEVSSEANGDDIKRAYRRLAKTYHPDSNPSDEARQVFLKISEAYQVLSDPQKRWRYDLLLDYENRPDPYGYQEPGNYAPHMGQTPPPEYYQAKAKKKKAEKQEFSRLVMLAKAICVVGLLFGLTLVVDYATAERSDMEVVRRASLGKQTNGEVKLRLVTNKGTTFYLDPEKINEIRKGDRLTFSKTPIYGIVRLVEVWHPSPLRGTQLLALYEGDSVLNGMTRVDSFYPDPGVYNVFAFGPIVLLLASLIGIAWPRGNPVIQYQISLLSGMFIVITFIMLMLS